MEAAQARNWLGIAAATVISLLITAGFGLSVKQLYMSLDDIRIAFFRLREGSQSRWRPPVPDPVIAGASFSRC